MWLLGRYSITKAAAMWSVYRVHTEISYIIKGAEVSGHAQMGTQMKKPIGRSKYLGASAQGSFMPTGAHPYSSTLLMFKGWSAELHVIEQNPQRSKVIYYEVSRHHIQEAFNSVLATSSHRWHTSVYLAGQPPLGVCSTQDGLPKTTASSHAKHPALS